MSSRMSGSSNQQSAVETPVRWPLIKAVENHDESEVKRLIAEGAVDVNEVDDQRRSALICAVQNNVDLNIIKTLVEEGNASVNAKDPRYKNRNSLFYAVTKSTKTASYLFEKAGYINDSDVSGILAFFTESFCTNKNDFCPTVDDILRILQDNEEDLTPEILATELARSIANILLCKIPLLSTSASDSHQPRNSDHLMFHLHEKRKSLLDALKKISECDYFVPENYPKIEGIKKVLKMIEERRSISNILDYLKERGADPNFADSHGNTSLHYATCLPWLGVPKETVSEICLQLWSFGVPLNTRNHLDQTPLLFCLSGSMEHLEDKVKAMKNLVDVCKFLVSNGSRLVERSRNGESVFHLVMKLFQQGLQILDPTVRQGVIEETVKLLDLFTPSKVGKIVQERGGDRLNSPLHLWASLVLTARVKDYVTPVTPEHTFEGLLKIILNHLLRCGALKNDRNKCEETPLHLCNTWSAVTLLIQKRAKPNDLDSKKRPPLLVAASNKTFLRNPSHFYPDFQKDAQNFFENAVKEKKLDPWTFDKECKESVLGFLIAFDTYDLSKALVEFACNLKEKDKIQKIFVSLLKAICKDEALHTHWKMELVKTVLLHAKERNINVANEPFNVCCETICNVLSPSSNESDGMGGNVAPPLSSGTVEEQDQMDVDRPSPSNDEEVDEPDEMTDDGPSPVEESDVMDGDGPPSTSETAEERDEMIDDCPPSSHEIVAESDAMDIDESPPLSSEIQNTIHCKIANMLCWYGAELSGQSYETLKARYPEIAKSLQGIDVQILIPWTSTSKKHKPVLEKVARRQECKEIDDKICCHLPAGSFGAGIFVGINMKNSREVAIKCIGETDCTQELKNLYAKLDCEQVIRYFRLVEHNEAERLFCFVFELMEGTLDDYLNGSDAFDSNKGTSLCGDVVKGLNYLHKHDFRHFQDHLKPTSIFYKTHPDLCLKITDFDHRQPADGISTYVCSSPEVLNSESHSKSSDIFSCGLLLHYILSEGEHPFSPDPADRTNKSEADIVSETESNIKDNNMKVEGSLSPEGAHLVTKMLSSNKEDRPTAVKALNHPLFWSEKKMVELLSAVGNQREFECPRAKRTLPLTVVENDLEASFSTIVKYLDWNDPGYVHMPAIYKEMTKKRKYDTHSVVELVRLIRNAYAHVSESTRPEPIRKLLLEDFVFLEYFPNLVMKVYKAVTTRGWDQKIDEIKYALEK